MRAVLGIAVLTTLLCAAVPITGAFGVTLGQVFDVKTAQGVIKEHKEPPFYLFMPVSPVKELDTYYIRITPKDDRVYEIWGIQYFETRRECRNVKKRVIEILTKKYGEPLTREKLANFLNPYTKFQSGDNTIVVDCSGFARYKLSVVYTNVTVEKKVEKVDNLFSDSNISEEGF